MVQFGYDIMSCTNMQALVVLTTYKGFKFKELKYLDYSVQVYYIFNSGFTWTKLTENLSTKLDFFSVYVCIIIFIK